MDAGRPYGFAYPLMPSETAMDAEHLQQPNDHVHSRHQCCHCCKPFGSESQDAESGESDSSTVNEVAPAGEYPSVLEYHSTRHSHAKLVRNKHAHQRSGTSGRFFLQ